MTLDCPPWRPFGALNSLMNSQLIARSLMNPLSLSFSLSQLSRILKRIESNIIIKYNHSPSFQVYQNLFSSTDRGRRQRKEDRKKTIEKGSGKINNPFCDKFLLLLFLLLLPFLPFSFPTNEPADKLLINLSNITSAIEGQDGSEK